MLDNSEASHTEKDRDDLALLISQIHNVPPAAVQAALDKGSASWSIEEDGIVSVERNNEKNFLLKIYFWLKQHIL